MKIKNILGFFLLPSLLLTSCGETTGKNKNKPVIDKERKTVEYGIYPQTHVSDSLLISSLNKLTDAESNGWYLYNNEYYAKLTLPYEITFDDGTTIPKRITCWFKCEPITWKILESKNGEYKLLSTVLLDVHCYYSSWEDRTIDGKTIYPNNYKYSDIRSWLNNEFYNTAFSLDNNYIQTTEVDNSASTTNYSDYYKEYIRLINDPDTTYNYKEELIDDFSEENTLTCENTNDKVYLLSYQDYCNESYGFSSNTARQCKTTDYARANGAYSNTSSSYKNNGRYWTRSPFYLLGMDNKYKYAYPGNFSLNTSVSGKLPVQPAITIKL